MCLPNRSHRVETLCVNFSTLNTIRLEVETENNILKMWSNFDPILRNSNPGTFSLLKP